MNLKNQKPLENVLKKDERIAPILDRIFAGTIDIVIIGTVVIIGVIVIAGHSFYVNFIIPNIFFIYLIFGGLYESFFLSYWGTTPGQKIFGMRTINRENGGKIKPLLAFVRGMGTHFYPAGFPLVPVSILFDKTGENRGWHDNTANSIVIQSRNWMKEYWLKIKGWFSDSS